MLIINIIIGALAISLLLGLGNLKYPEIPCVALLAGYIALQIKAQKKKKQKEEEMRSWPKELRSTYQRQVENRWLVRNSGKIMAATNVVIAGIIIVHMLG